MPLWKVYHPVGAYSAADKKKMAGEIADIYARFMPRFYVNVLFQEIPADSFYIGGEPRDNFVRIVMEHIAREFQTKAVSDGFINKANKVLKPWVGDRGYDWEFHIDETEFDHWSVQGYFPPRPGTPDEIRWMEENRPSPRTHD